LELAGEKVWFAGNVLQTRKSKEGKKYYYIHVTHYKGKKLQLNFWGGIWENFLTAYGVSENLMNKFLEIKLKNIYTKKSDLDLSIKISKSKIQGQFDFGTFDEEKELNEKEIKNLMALDWSTISCQKKIV